MPSEPIEILIDDVVLSGDLTVPKNAHGLVLFAHGSGSSRKSPRNRAVAAHFNLGGLATLLFDLLTPEEEAIDERTRHLRFDIDLLSTRLIHAAQWVKKNPSTKHLAIGTFGSSTGAAAALRAAAALPEIVRAVVSRGGRPDLAGHDLTKVKAPTLLIVGGEDTVVIGMNREAMTFLDCEKKIEIVPGATHLFEEPGTLDVVAVLAQRWFSKYLG